MPRTTSNNGQLFIVSWEAVVLRAYPDPATGGAPWTIGVGHTSAAGKPVVAKGMVISRETAFEILARDLVVVEGYVNTGVKATLGQGQFDALVSLCFNIGSTKFLASDVVRLLNGRNYLDAGAAFGHYIRADGKISAGLVNRRRAERALFETGAYGPALLPGADEMTGAVLRRGCGHPDAVRALQADLNALGLLSPEMCDGAFGTRTEAAVRVFQDEHGLTADGRAGPATRAAIAAALARAKKPAAVPMFPHRAQAIEAVKAV